MSEQQPKRLGYYTDMLSIAPQSVKGGERELVILGIGIAGLLFLVAANTSAPVLWMASAVVFYLAWHAGACLCWRLDRWMSKILPRFLAYPKVISARSTVAASPRKKLAERRREKMKR